MQITKITVAFGSTVNLGNYNSARFDVALEAQLEAGDDPLLVAQQLHEQAREEARRQALPVIRRNNVQLEEVVRHLPEALQQQIMSFNGADR